MIDFVNDEIGIMTPEQEQCYTKLLYIRRQKKEGRIYDGIEVKTTETEDGVYDIKYAFIHHLSEQEVFARGFAHAIMNGL